MLTFDQTRDAIRRELDETAAVLEALPERDWSADTRCEGWDVTALVCHVADAASFQGEAYRRMLAGSTETPPVPELVRGTSSEALARLRAGRDHVLRALDAIGPDQQDGLVPLPFATLPASIANVVLLIEYGFHRNDLLWAIGRKDPLPADIASTTIETLPGFLPMIETKPADAPLAYTLASPSGMVTVVTVDSGWAVGEPGDAPVVKISGDDSSLALFALGRIRATDPSLTVDGDLDVASRFKHHFPGP